MLNLVGHSGPVKGSRKCAKHSSCSEGCGKKMFSPSSLLPELREGVAQRRGRSKEGGI